MNEEVTNVDEAQIGRILHYVLDNGVALRCRPAIVTEDFSFNKKLGHVNVKVHLDGQNDDPKSLTNGTVWKTAVSPDHIQKTSGTWHWPRECAHMKEAFNATKP